MSQGTLDQFWLWSMQAGLKNAYDSIKAFSETDFTEDLKKFDIPTLVMHGEDDQIVPVKNSAKKSAQLIKGAMEIYYPGLPHGLTATHADLVNRDLLAFCQQASGRSRSPLHQETRLRSRPLEQAASKSLPEYWLVSRCVDSLWSSRAIEYARRAFRAVPVQSRHAIVALCGEPRAARRTPHDAEDARGGDRASRPGSVRQASTVRCDSRWRRERCA